MTESEFHGALVQGVFVVAALTAAALLFITAPYGRHGRGGWGPTMDTRLAWVVMESPSVLWFLAVYLAGGQAWSIVPLLLLAMWQSHYVQRNYADAAEAFDLVISAYGTSSKAPDAQLKRGMALAQLGKRQDACTALRSVGSKYPSAPVQLKAKADSERQRSGCP